MGRRIHCLAFLIVLIGALTLSASAAAPPLMNYQGRLTDSLGAPLDTTVSMIFTIYADSTSGTPRWSETHSSVTVSLGLFNVVLGSVQMLDYSIFDTTSLWLGVTVGGDPEIVPRSRIVSSAFAQRVSTIDNTSGGTVYGSVEITSSLNVGSKATVGAGHTNTGPYGFVAGFENVLTGERATIGGGAGNEAGGRYAVVPGGYSNRSLGDYSLALGYMANADHEGTFVFSDHSAGEFSSSAPDQFLIRAVGGVGVGTDTPSEQLDVNGTSQMTGFKMPTDASDGYVLTSDADGKGTWQAAGFGGSDAGAFDGEVNSDMVELGGVTDIDFDTPFTCTEEPHMFVSVVLKAPANGLSEGAAIRAVVGIKGSSGNWTGFDTAVSKYSDGTSINDLTPVFVTWMAVGR